MTTFPVPSACTQSIDREVPHEPRSRGQISHPMRQPPRKKKKKKKKKKKMAGKMTGFKKREEQTNVEAAARFSVFVNEEREIG